LEVGEDSKEDAREHAYSGVQGDSSSSSGTLSSRRWVKRVWRMSGVLGDSSSSSDTLSSRRWVKIIRRMSGRMFRRGGR
jgi:hypothetical protein